MSREGAVREALHRYISWYSPDQDHQVINEFWVPITHERVDVTVIGSMMQAFEIKTSHDTLRRLSRQATAYGRVFDQCTAVVAECHSESTMAIVPEWWGILLIGGGETPTLTQIREPGSNPDVDPRTLVRLLWRDEAHAALAELGVALPARSGRAAMWDELLRVTDTEKLRGIVTHAFQRRHAEGARYRWRRITANPAETTGR